MPNKGNAPPRVPACHPDRRHVAKGLCKQCYDADYSERNRAALNARARAWAAGNPERRRQIRRRYLYGIDAATVEARLNAQDGLCKICATRPAGNLDHCHRSGEARGLLCGNCNRGLGLFKDDPAILQGAIRYLELWDASSAGNDTDGVSP